MRMMFRYRVRDNQIEQHRTQLTDVFEELEALRPAGIRYDAHVLADGVTFVDLVEGPALPGLLTELPAFGRFRAELEARCTAPVRMEELTELHSYPAGPRPPEVTSEAFDRDRLAGIWFTDSETDYLASQLLGRLATVDPSGAPQNNPVGYTLDADQQQIVIGGLEMGASRKFRNADRHPPVAFVVDDLAAIKPWTPRGVEVRGVATAAVDQDPPMNGFSAEAIRITPTWIASWGVTPGTSFDLQSRRAR